MPEVVELHAGDIDASLASAWDALPPARGMQADIYDSHAWFAAWLSSQADGIADRVRIPAVVDSGRPVALLPLVLSRSGRRAGVLGMQDRTRARPVIGTEQPQHETLGLLAEAVARCGIRDIDLHRLPSRDPAAAPFVDALREAGFRISQRERSADNLAQVEGDWADYARTFKGFAGYARRFSGRLESLWEIDAEAYGTTPGRPAADGFRCYEELHRRSWKGELSQTARMLRADLLQRVESNGWARVFVLRVGGVAAAAHIWFRLGHVATWLSTAYDQKLAAFSPGTVSMWAAQRTLLNEIPHPRLVDLLPGSNPQKDRLTLSKPPLLVTEAIRPTVWAGVSVPARRQGRRAQAAIAARVRVRRRQIVDEPEPGRIVSVAAVPDARNANAYRLNVTAAHRRYLATTVGHAAPEKMAASWGAADEWWVSGNSPDGLIRIARGQAGVTVREIVRLKSAAEPEVLIAALASVLKQEVVAHAVPLHDAVLPWPRSWRHVEVGQQT